MGFTQLHAESGEKHESNVALDHERALGGFLDPIGQLGLVLIGIESCRDVNHASNEQNYQAEDGI